MKKLLTSIILIAVALLFSAPCFAGLDPAEEARHADLKKMCAELKVPPPPEIFIRLQVHDKDGKLIFDDRQRGHSWTRNFWNMMFGLSSDAVGGGSNNFGAGYMSSKVAAGTIRYSNVMTPHRTTFTALGAGIINHNLSFTPVEAGIVIGTGTGAFSVDNYVMGTLIAHGNAATQMAYNGMANGTIAYDSGTNIWKNTLTRVFNNNSGDTIVVGEVGLYNQGRIFHNSSETILMERSVLSPSVSVANGAQLTVTYEISMDFSAID